LKLGTTKEHKRSIFFVANFVAPVHRFIRRSFSEGGSRIRGGGSFVDPGIPLLTTSVRQLCGRTKSSGTCRTKEKPPKMAKIMSKKEVAKFTGKKIYLPDYELLVFL
jgi:hypothetical protein